MEVILILLLLGFIVCLVTTIFLQIKNRNRDSTIISNATASLYGVYVLVAAFYPYNGVDVGLNIIAMFYMMGITVAIGWKLLWNKKKIWALMITGAVVSFFSLVAQLYRYKENSLSENVLDFAITFMVGVLILTIIGIVKNNLLAPILIKTLIINYIVVAILFTILPPLDIATMVASIIMIALLGVIPGLVLRGLYKKFYEEKEEIFIKELPIEKEEGGKLFRLRELGDAKPDDRILRYCESMEEAILSSRLGEGGGYVVKNIKEILKIIENDGYRIIFFTTGTDQGDKVAVFKLRKKLEGERVFYSKAIYSTLFNWEKAQLNIEELRNRYNETEILRETIKSDLFFRNGRGDFNLEGVAEKLKWGLYNDGIVKEITINGKGPTNIITLTLDDEVIYLWYYENIPSGDNEIDHLVIDY